ncbi:unnamed protein product, partial [Closterium sp. Naga37s-1]
VCLLYQLLYVMDATPHYSPVLHLLSLSLRRATPQELAEASSSISTRRQRESERLPGSPAIRVAHAGIPVPADRSLCPLCLCRRTNPTAPGTSGFIFCYPCIFAYVDK